MSKYVSIDDPITRVSADYTICETVDSVTREGFSTTSARGVTSLRHDDERLTWVRGWHLPDSEDVQAARAAQALDDNKERMAQAEPRFGQHAEGALKALHDMGMLGGLPQPSPPQPPGLFGVPYHLDIGDGARGAPTTTAPAPVPFPGSTVIVSKSDC